MRPSLVFYDDKPHEYADVITRYPELRFAYDEILDLIRSHGMPNIGRWAYCKCCYMNVLPRVSFGDGLVICARCLAGLGLLKDVILAGSYQEYERRWRLKPQ